MMARRFTAGKVRRGRNKGPIKALRRKALLRRYLPFVAGNAPTPILANDTRNVLASFLQTIHGRTLELEQHLCPGRYTIFVLV
jgi:hypothetical protein